VKCSDYDALVELGTICAMCNDSSVDYNEVLMNCGCITSYKLIICAHAASRYCFWRRLSVCLSVCLSAQNLKVY